MLKCAICGNKKTKFFHKINKYSYFFCQKCQTLFLFPKPKQKQINNYYRQSFRYTAGETNEKNIRKRAKIILKHLFNLKPDAKTLLDVGSGLGYFLDEAKQQELDTIGIEPSKFLYVQSINRLDVKVIQSDFEKYYMNYKKQNYDFIAIIHTIEHVFNPKEMINKALKLLNPGGILYIETPNLNSHLFASEKTNYTFLTPPDHIWIFSVKSFNYIFKQIPRADISNVSTYSAPEHFVGIIKKIIRSNNKQNSSMSLHFIKIMKLAKYIIFDNIIAKIFTPLLNINHKGSILELYIKRN